jgi:glycosyltransferase involved in cell wall biosynthesis
MIVVGSFDQSAAARPEIPREVAMSSRRPTVSLGMPVYNAEPYLEQALDALLAQSFEDFEVMISDNASTDATEEICRSYADKDDRIRYVRSRANFGVIHNFNTVFRLSAGRYFKWAAADDVCGEDYLRRAVEVLDGDPSVVLAWAKTAGIDQQGRRVELPNEISDLNAPTSVYSTDPVVRWRRLLRNIWWVDGPFYGVMRADALGRTRWLHPPHPSGDQILLTELSLGGRFYEIPEELFLSRIHPNKTSRRQRALSARAGFLRGRRHSQRPLERLRNLRVYPTRLAMYSVIVMDAPLSPGQKLRCEAEVVRAVGTWAATRTRQVASGSSPWR